MDPVSDSNAAAPTPTETPASSGAQHQFRTKTGICTITPTQILLGREGAVGTAASAGHGSSNWSTIAVNAVVGVFFLGLAAWFVVNQDAFAIISAFVGGYLLWSAFTSRNDSAANVIERASIKSVEAHAPRPLLTLGHFTVRFIENGEERKRQILLPGSWSGGKKAYAQAVAQMRAAGLLEGGTGDASYPSA